MKKTARFVVSMLVLLGLLGFVSGDGAMAYPSWTDTLASVPITNEECIRNGGFDYDKAGWTTNLIGTHVGDGFGKNGAGYGMQIWPEFSNYYGFMWQELYLPTQTTAASLSFDYAFLPQSGPSLGYFSARVVTDTGTIATLVYVTPATYPGETWQSTGALAFGAGELAALNAAHAAGQHVYLLIDLNAQNLYVNVDNVSFIVDGNKTIPAWSGSIAYIGLDGSGYAKTVRRINPDGSTPQTVWTHPETGITNKMGDVAWKPDASELALGSNHESLYSAFQSDVYGVKPDGSGLRRITNPPSKAELLAGSYDTGTVIGKVRNDYGSLTTLLLYVQGAQEAVSVPAYSKYDEVSFTVPNVAVLDGLQYVVFTWSDGSHANCKEYTAAVLPMLPDQTIDVGTLGFNPATCSTFESQGITWKRDGAELAADVITPRKFQATGQAIGSDLFNGPLTANLPAWSPLNEQVLYHYWSLDAGTRGIYLTTDGGDTGARLVNDEGAVWVGLAWLPDGSGFVYTLDHKLYHYHLASAVITPIANFYNEYISNPSVSPDGRYVVFQWQTGVSNRHDLWILDRTNPVEMWQLTSDGQSTNPDWSRQDPPAPPTCPAPLTGVSIGGPTAGYTGTAYTFNAAIVPANATTPITYTWSPEPASGQGSTSASYTWASTGAQTINVTAKNCGGSPSDSHTITISQPLPGCSVPLSGVTINGPTTGYTGTTYAFNAAIVPANATAPITYTWSPEPVSGQGAPSASYTWAMTGAKTISLTATNCGGTATDGHTIAINALGIQYYVYLPLVVRNS